MEGSTSLSTLPIELLALIVGEVASVQDRASRHASEHLYENLAIGTTSRPGLVALAETNSIFHGLCVPWLWREVNMAKRNNADYLYFFHIILPRHGPHVRRLLGIDIDGFTHKGRENIPAYLARSLGISPRFGYTSPASTCMDLRLLGEELLLPHEPAGAKVYDPSPKSIRHRTQLRLQTVQLLTMIITSPDLLKLDTLSIDVTGLMTLISSTFASLRNALAAKPTQLTTLIVEHFPADDWSNTRAKATQEALAGMLESCLSVTDLDLTLSWEDRLDNVALKPVIEALQGMESLERLSLSDLHVEKSWSASLWAAPVTCLVLHDVKGDHQDILLLAGCFSSTLDTLSIAFRMPEITPPHSPVVPSIDFPELSDVTLSSEIPVGFLQYFRNSPLEYIRSYQDNGDESGGVEAAEWKTVFKDHGSTLLMVDGHNGDISVEEEKELKEEAKKLNFTLYLSTSPQDDN